ncbi:MAG: NYN domain-containing protein [Treponemataceae bacterium]|nr:MAG: NYN domain-containing protein [Treponemataceae bacterium]
MKEYDFSNIAVLVDPENISYKYLQKIFESIAAFGQISVRRIYSDWTDNTRKAWKPLIHEFSLVAIQQFSNTGSKSVSDFTLVIDAMDLLHEGIIDCFCIVSSDSDFTRLAQRIKEKGKIVIGLGERKAVKAFVNACNEFIYLNDELLEQEENKLEKNSENIIKEEETIDSLMDKAVENLSNQDGWAQMNKIIPYIKQIKSDFDISNYPISGKPIKRLRKYFENNRKYELDKENTIVRKK